MTTPTPGTIWLVVTVVAAVTLAFRLSFFLVFDGDTDLPERLELVLWYVAPAVLAALVVPELVYLDGTLALANPRLVAGVVAAAVARYTGNIAVTVTVGMVVFWTLGAVL